MEERNEENQIEAGEKVSHMVPVKEQIIASDEEDSWSDMTVTGPSTVDGRLPTTIIEHGKDIARKHQKTLKKRKSKKHRARKISQKYKSIGRTITKGDKSYELMFDMLLGIRTSVSATTAKQKLETITQNEISRIDDYYFPSEGSDITPAHLGKDFKFRDYAANVFRDIRERNGIDSVEYLISLTADYALSEIISPGKSGSFFYFSKDTKYILKTISRSEKSFLKSILREYHQHILKNPNSLIIRFYGFHMVQAHNHPKAHFVVMGNVFAQSLDIQEVYDLKGSTVGRTIGEEKFRNSSLTRKDLDFHRKITLGPEKCQMFWKQLEADCQFFERTNIMDYSLLLGVHNKSVTIKNTGKIPRYKHQKEARKCGSVFTREYGGFQATDKNNSPLPEIYFMGIIDILQPYNMAKKFEHAWKKTILQLNPLEISAVSPSIYADRFLRFIKSNCSTEDAPQISQGFKEAKHRAKKRRKSRHSKIATPVDVKPLSQPLERAVNENLIRTPELCLDACIWKNRIQPLSDRLWLNSNPLETSEEKIEIPDSLPKFNVRIPKRKRVKEKCLSNLHPLEHL